MHNLAKRLGLLATFGLVSLLASGCVSTVNTNVAITKSSDTITVSINLNGDAAAVISRTPSLIAELNKVLTVRTGTVQHATVTPTLISWSDTITDAQLIANKDILGVGGLTSKPLGSSDQVSVGLIDPTGLDAAIAAGAKGQPNAAALIITMEHYTTLTTQISFPGAVTLVSASGVTPQLSANSASVTQNLFSYHPGAFVVDGSLAGPSFPWLYVVLGVLVVAGLIYFLGRKR